MKEKFAKFMQDRYGNDELNRALSVSALILFVISMLFMGNNVITYNILWIAGLILLVISYYRAFSKNIPERTAENQKLLNFRYKSAVKKQQVEQHKEYKFFKCPKCGVYNRIPKGRGKILITCPKCDERFEGKS